MFQLGIDVLLSSPKKIAELSGKRVAVLGHPPSLTSQFRRSIDALAAVKGLRLGAAFGPQHGMHGELQDNMQETPDYIDPTHKIPVFSLYGEVRRPTEKMLQTFDIILVDLQDVGTRIYTFLTTLLYVLEECAKYKKAVWVLDRPNPAGRPVEGSLLRPGWMSFVGACEGLPMRHGLTMGEAALWFQRRFKLDVDLQIVQMEGYNPTTGPGFGWPMNEISWVNPSPNAATLSMARCFPGTVLIEGTHLSEGRGTTRPLETLGGPGLEMEKVLAKMNAIAPDWIQGCRLRPCFFQPTFQKHAGKIIPGVQIHVDDTAYQHESFRPYRLVATWLKAIRTLYPGYEIWRDFHYEYEKNRLAFDLINGGPQLREWIDDQSSSAADLDKICLPDERAWLEDRQECLIYPS